MPRYCFEVAYKGTQYAGFQTQQNANTIQDELEKALLVLFKTQIALTGSSRTDAGVHARQNFFHADTEIIFVAKQVYNLNAILPADIVLKSIFLVASDFHCRFLAGYRRYRYHIYNQKNPFVADVAWHFPYALNIDDLNAAAELLMRYNDFSSFSKRNTQTHTKMCQIFKSHWFWENDLLVYEVQANRFLRGMVRGLVATQLQVGRQKVGLVAFAEIIESLNSSKADFSAPAHGLFLEEVSFPPGVFRPIT